MGERLAAVIARAEVPTPYIYPTPEGDVRAEWSATEWEVSVTFALGTREARMFAASLGSKEFIERTVLMDGPSAESELGLFLGEHLRPPV